MTKELIEASPAIEEEDVRTCSNSLCRKLAEVFVRVKGNSLAISFVMINH